MAQRTSRARPAHWGSPSHDVGAEGRKTPFAPSAAKVWGDGFADDDFSELAAVKEWRDLSSHEYIRVFPALLPRDAAVPVAVKAHVAECVAVRAWRLRSRQGQPIGGPASVGAQAVGSVSQEQHDVWFAPCHGLWRLVRSLYVRNRRPPDTEHERAALTFLDEILCEIQTSSLRSFDRAAAVQFAFETGVHPAYLWPAAMVEQEMFGAAGWLGFLARGHSALLPADLAAYFDDIIVGDALLTVRDPQIARLLRRPALIVAVRRASRARALGRRCVVSGRLTERVAANDRSHRGGPPAGLGVTARVAGEAS